MTVEPHSTARPASLLIPATAVFLAIYIPLETYAMAERLRQAVLNQNGWTEADTSRILLVGIVLIALACAGMFGGVRMATARRSGADGVAPT